jgi:hypothetical protein
MKLICNITNKEIKSGNLVRIHKLYNGNWGFTGKHGVFEEITASGFINFTQEGKPRQCLPEGINARIE